MFNSIANKTPSSLRQPPRGQGPDTFKSTQAISRAISSDASSQHGSHQPHQPSLARQPGPINQTNAMPHSKQGHQGMLSRTAGAASRVAVSAPGPSKVAARQQQDARDAFHALRRSQAPPSTSHHRTSLPGSIDSNESHSFPTDSHGSDSFQPLLPQMLPNDPKGKGREEPNHQIRKMQKNAVPPEADIRRGPGGLPLRLGTGPVANSGLNGLNTNTCLVQALPLSTLMKHADIPHSHRPNAVLANKPLIESSKT
jgi:hypothetical protein